jgi:hypothetical protein
MQQWEWFKFCLDTKNYGALPLDLACLKHLSVWSLINLFYMPKFAPFEKSMGILPYTS